ncbi:MAG: bifunctional 3-demethylubiquinol 3-O-methyltransferase/2-polyprenyl-6-hydroxyphenol methylase, partial [Methylophilaceae bacterium]
YAFAVLGAEYILQMLPKGTHDYAKFIKPSELASFSRQAGLTLQDQVGMSYNPITKHYSLNKDVSVNYLVYTVKAVD